MIDNNSNDNWRSWHRKREQVTTLFLRACQGSTRGRRDGRLGNKSISKRASRKRGSKARLMSKRRNGGWRRWHRNRRGGGDNDGTVKLTTSIACLLSCWLELRRTVFVIHWSLEDCIAKDSANADAIAIGSALSPIGSAPARNARHIGGV